MKKHLESIKLFLKETDLFLLITCILTSVFGLVMVCSATNYKLKPDEIMSRDSIIMMLAIILGIILCLFISYFNYEVFTKFWLIIGIVSLISMILLFFIGSGPQSRPDVHTWIKLKFFSIQPSEFVKIGFIITFSVHLEKLKDKINHPLSILQLAIHALIPTLLVIKTGDMGSALVFMFISVAMLFMAGVHWGYFLGGLGFLAAIFPLIWMFMFSSIQKNRFLAILNPEEYPDIIYQQERSITAIGAGGVSGQGLFEGAYTQAGYVPEAQNDMIFSVISEELGFIGAIVALSLLAFIAVRTLYIGRKSREQSTNLICCGISSMLFGQVIINIGMCLMLLPCIGITLPFFSAGGSSNLSVYIGIGLVLSIYRHNCDRGAEDVHIYDTLKK